MDCLQSIELIRSFSTFPVNQTTKGKTKREKLEQQKHLVLPKELQTYIEQVCPDKNITIGGVGHPIEILSIEQLSWQMIGYNFDSTKKIAIENWQDNWFLIANEGGEPIIVDLAERDRLSPVYSALQTSKGWDFAPIADSIGQFLLSVKAIEHAMNFPGIDEALDENFNLAMPAAQWLFPFLKKHTANHFDEWASVFENYLD